MMGRVAELQDKKRAVIAGGVELYKLESVMGQKYQPSWGGCHNVAQIAVAVRVSSAFTTRGIDIITQLQAERKCQNVCHFSG